MSEARTQIRVTKGKLVPSDLGNPSLVKVKPEGDSSPHVVGIVIGRITKVESWTSTNKLTGEVQAVPKLLGSFEGRRATPIDNGNGTETFAIRSGVCYLPSGIVDQLAEAFKLLSGDDKPFVDFALQLMTVKANNPAGYSWQAIELYRPAATDPLGEVMSALERPQLEVSSEVTVADAEARERQGRRREHATA